MGRREERARGLVRGLGSGFSSTLESRGTARKAPVVYVERLL